MIPKVRKSIPYDAGHYFYVEINPYKAIISDPCPATVLYICFWIHLLIVIFSSFFQKLVSLITNAWCPSMSISELDDNPEEVIDNYFKCLDNEDRNWSIKEELNNRNELKMHCLLDGTLEKLEKNKMGKQSL